MSDNLKRRSDDPKPKTNLQRQLELKQRRHEAGFHTLHEWVHDDDREALKLYAKRLRKIRFEDQERTV